MRIISYGFLLLIVLLGVGFAMLNAEVVNINYYVGHKSLPLSLLLVCSFAAGGALGAGVGVLLLFKAKLKGYRLRQQLKLAEKEIENLRAIPLQDKH